MNFEIEDNNTKKKKQKAKKEKIYIYLVFGFLGLSILLFIIYFIGINKPKKTTPVTQPTKEVKELNVVKENSNERPIAVVIDNNMGDIQTSGLMESYINYEFIVEGGATRIMAIFKDREVPNVGPVRSARDYMLDYALEHDAIFAHFGWSPKAESDIKSLNVNNINGMTDTTPFARDKKIESPHNVFTSTTKLKNYLGTKNYASTSTSWKVLKYSTEDINLDKVNSTATNATKINIEYSGDQYRTYVYDNSKKYYLRSQNGKAQIDKRTDHQLIYKNIIIMKVENKTIDNVGRQELTTIGSNSGYYITNGKVLPIKWSKSSRQEKTTYMYETGEEIKVNDGNTFIQVVPISSKITIE